MSDQAKAREMRDEEAARDYYPNGSYSGERIRAAYLAGIKRGEEKQQKTIEHLRHELKMGHSCAVQLTTERARAAKLVEAIEEIWNMDSGDAACAPPTQQKRRSRSTGRGMRGNMKFRKKPVTIDAFRFTFDQVPDWWKNARGIEIEVGTCIALIPTLEGTMRANKGDWIIRGVKGEIYPCKPDIFELTYDAVP